MSLENNKYEPVFQPDQGVEGVGSVPSIESPNLSGFVGGEHISRNRGRGRERDGVREYQFGDNVKDIDWRLTARQSEGSMPVIRTHVSEVTPSIYIATDVFKDRSSVNQGHFSEKNLGASVIASLLKTAIKQDIPTALIAGTDEGIYVQPNPVIGRLARTFQDISLLSNGEYISQELASGRFETDKKEDIRLSTVIDRVGKLATRSIIFVVSDFRGDSYLPSDDNGWLEALEALKSQDNSVVAVELIQPGDFELHDKTETFSTRRRVLHIGSDKKDKIGQDIRRNYSKAALIKKQAIDEALADSCEAHIELKTDNGLWLTSLREQLRAKLR